MPIPLPPIRRDNLHTFSDSTRAVYTVVHVPDEFQIPNTDLNDNAINSVSLQFLRRPQRWSPRFPELAYLLRSNCAHDVLLSRLAADEKILQPIKYAQNEWGLDWQIRQSWKRLEIALGVIANELINSCSQDYESEGMRPFEYWPDPSDARYLDLHRTEQKARSAILQARQSFYLLAARCSMAIAIWIKGASTAYSWVSWLDARGVDSTWLDALQQSVISQFAPGLRVGVFVAPLSCNAIPHLPVLRRSFVPLFIRWRDHGTLKAACERYPVLKQFAPLGDDAMNAYHNPQLNAGQNIFVLFHKNSMHVLPPSTDLNAFKPVGPYQRPGESSREFILRMDMQAREAVNNENEFQRMRRLRRLGRADIEEVPPPWIKVYVWLKAVDVDPDIRPQWKDLDIRVLVPSGAVPGLWFTHKRSHKYYHYLYDSWDLGADIPPNLQIDGGMDLPGSVQGGETEMDLSTALSMDLDFIYRPVPSKGTSVHVSESIVRDYYGLIPSESTHPDVDYLTHRGNVERFLGLIHDDLEGDIDARNTYAGFIWAALSDRLYSSATCDCWDLDPRCNSYLLEQKGLADRVIRITSAGTTQASRFRLYFIQYRADINATWLLAASAHVVVYLLRQQTITTSVDASLHLASVGLPFHTLFLAASLRARESFDLSLLSYSLPTYRHSGFTPTPLDYHVYELRVMELLHRPHVRAALMGGGIVWRIAMDIMEYDDDLAQTVRSSVVSGPSDNAAAHVSLVKTKDGLYYVDDVLSREEHDVFAGVVTVYTDQRGQTESVSWWPRQVQWQGSGMDNGIWSAWNEAYYQRRLQDIKEGRARLMNTSGWKSALAQFRASHLVQAKLERACEEFLTLD